jgi:simple sugar transport system permease protein
MTKVKWQMPGPVLAIVGGLLIGAVIMLFSGNNPLEGYSAMFFGALGGRNGTNLASTLARAAPIVGMGLTAAIASRAGFFNLGGEGQLVLGGLAAALVALNVPLPAFLLVPLTILVAMLVGGAFALLPTWAQFNFRVPMLISTLLLNYPARFFASYVVVNLVRDVASGMPQTHQIDEGLQFPLLLSGTQLHAGVFITLVVAIATTMFISKSVAGYELRMMGLNPRFAEYGGVPMRKLGYAVMFASGAIAGLVGAIEVLGVNYRFIDDALTSPQYAWVGLMAALLSGGAPLGVLVAGLFFSAVQTGGFGMERATEIPRELARVLQAVIILFVAVRGGGGRDWRPGSKE